MIGSSGDTFYNVSAGTIVGMSAKRKTADESVTSSLTLQNDDHLSFTIGANQEWIAMFALDIGAALSTTGIKVAVTTPASATQNVSASLSPDVLAASNRSFARTTVSGTALDFTAATQVGVSNGAIYLSLWVLNGATAGTVQLQFAQSTSSVTAITVRKGSNMVAHRIV